MIFNWILVNKLAIGTPLINLEDKLYLKEKKIISILDLRNEFDLHEIDYDKKLALYEEFNLVNVGLPDHNSKRFAKKSEIENAINILEKLLLHGPVFMHCHAAVERSPLISIAYLIKIRQLNLTQAYEYVKVQNKTTNILIGQLKNI
tara:strand:+ start:59 stop:499 length:441 start_codon:yes stop_codon:yes gene_type:complete